ncbi:MAG: hypothetical protein IJM63_05500 [Solobacterium sp.]|nr:hypothetical protein [Solobacterium sp.]MBQ9823931.1 hypothetical protein [Solobacterium sp.]
MSGKNTEMMSDHELLAELVEMNRKKQTMNMIMLVLGVIALAAVIITAVIMVPRMIQSLNSINTSMETVDKLAAEIETSLTEVDKIDFDTLNSAITDFSKVVGALSKWFH